jgi:hypothetical protein
VTNAAALTTFPKPFQVAVPASISTSHGMNPYDTTTEREELDSEEVLRQTESSVPKLVRTDGYVVRSEHWNIDVKLGKERRQC